MNANRLLFAVAALVTAGYSVAAAAGDADRAAIQQVLQTSAQDWSRGDLAAFMRCYEDAPDTAFVTPQGLITGYSALRSHYAKQYASGDSKMGKLGLVLLDDRPLSADYVLVTGRFDLTRPVANGGNASGIFTLLMHRGRLGWRIAYDHTS